MMTYVAVPEVGMAAADRTSSFNSIFIDNHFALSIR